MGSIKPLLRLKETATAGEKDASKIKNRSTAEDEAITWKTTEHLVGTITSTSSPPSASKALVCVAAFHKIEIEELLLSAAPGDLPRSFDVAQGPVHKRAAVATLLVNSCWPSCLAGIAKKGHFWKILLLL